LEAVAEEETTVLEAVPDELLDSEEAV